MTTSPNTNVTPRELATLNVIAETAMSFSGVPFEEAIACAQWIGVLQDRYANDVDLKTMGKEKAMGGLLTSLQQKHLVHMDDYGSDKIGALNSNNTVELTKAGWQLVKDLRDLRGMDDEDGGYKGTEPVPGLNGTEKKAPKPEPKTEKQVKVSEAEQDLINDIAIGIIDTNGCDATNIQTYHFLPCHVLTFSKHFIGTIEGGRFKRIRAGLLSSLSKKGLITLADNTAGHRSVSLTAEGKALVNLS